MKTGIWIIRRVDAEDPTELALVVQETGSAPTVFFACPDIVHDDAVPLVAFIDEALRPAVTSFFSEENAPNRFIPVCYTPGRPGLTSLSGGESVSADRLASMIRDRARICRLQGRLHELSGISQSLTAGTDIGQLLEQIMDAGIRLTDADAGSMYLVVDSIAHRWASIRHGDISVCMLQFVYARNRSLSIDFETFFTPIREDSINGHAILTGLPVRIADAYRIPVESPYRHDRSFDIHSGYRTCSMLTLPLKDRQNDIIGVIQLINKKKDPEEVLDVTHPSVTTHILPFTADDEELMRVFAGQATVAIENTLLYQEQRELLESQRALNEELTAMNSKLIELSRKILTAHEEERKRIARDIHDGPAQTVANLILRTEICRKLSERGDMSAMATQLDSLQKSIRMASSDIRTIIYNLKPSWLDEGLFKAIRSRLDVLAEAGSIRTVAVLEGEDGTLPQYIASAVFQIIQESLTNTTKYAEATLVEVNIRITEAMLFATVRDNGKGFDAGEVEKRVMNRKPGSGFGMEGMRERVLLLRGDLTVKSAPGEGTSIIVSIPL